jgi:hypothetical protein
VSTDAQKAQLTRRVLRQDSLTLDIGWGLGEPLAEHTGRYVVLLLQSTGGDGSKNRWTRIETWSPSTKRWGTVEGYFVLPDRWWRLFLGLAREH